jgi:hypothetical protein
MSKLQGKVSVVTGGTFTKLILGDYFSGVLLLLIETIRGVILVARAKGFETNPMSGFDKERFAKEFELEDRYVPMALIPIGKGAKAGHPTTRLPIDKGIFWDK